MLEGLYSAAAGMAAQQQRMDSLANDVANVNTAGYKQLRTGFRDLVYAQQGRGAANGVETGSGAAAQTVGRSFAQGSLQQTGQPLDVALQGPGFLQVRTAEGQLALTRDGSLRLANNGALITSTGATVEPPINFPAGTTSLENVSIAPDGTITSGNQVIGRLVAVDVRAPQALTSIGDNLFVANADSGAPQAVPTTFAGGYIEASNVSLADAMVDMMQAEKAYQLSSRAIRQQDEMAGIANGIRR